MPSRTDTYSQHTLQRVASFIQQHYLLDDNLHTLYVGLSGGPDSVALLHVLRRLEGFEGFERFEKLKEVEIVALHCNFHLRGSESDRDQRFCKELCQRLGVRLIIKEFDTRAYMLEHHLSLEMAARQLRYDWWASLLSNPSNPSNSPQIALGHHQDDSIETTLMNLMRGTGIQGLTGIVPKNEATHVIRPLLCLSRQEILDYLDANGLTYVEDSTNAENDTLRNQIRNRLLPLMEQILPHAKQGICSTMEHLQECAELTEQAVEQYVAMHAVSHTIDGYNYEVWDAPCIHPFHVQQHYIRKGYTFDGQVATPSGQTLPSHPLFDASLHETFDSDQLQFPLRWRRWQQGDRMAPLGMDGHTKLVSDLFSNAHYLPIQKQLAWLLVDASDQILWIPGLRMCHHARVTPQTSHTVTIRYGEISFPSESPSGVKNGRPVASEVLSALSVVPSEA